MRKYFVLSALLLFVAGAVVIFGKFYPIAIVDGSFVWYRTWQRLVQGTGQAVVMQATASGQKIPADMQIGSVIRKGTLTALIEDAIIRRRAGGVITHFEAESKEKVDRIAGDKDKMQRAAKLMYGFSLAEFNNLILMPQSRREVAGEELEKQKIIFDDWLKDAKKDAVVRLLFVPYSWDGELVK